MALILQYISDESDSIKEVSEIFRKFKDKNICYVTLSKSCGAMREIFAKGDLGADRVYYIDGISSTIRSPSAVKGCFYVDMPYNLKAIGEEVKKAIKAGSSLVVFDSLSDILAYGTAVPAGMNLLVDFIYSFSKQLEAKKGDAIFLCKKGDAENLLIEETLPVFEKVEGK